MTFPDAVAAALKAAGKEADFAKFEAETEGASLEKMRAVAKGLGVEPFFDWEVPRTVEGYYRVKCGTKYAIMRQRAFARHSDLCWMETGKPGVKQAKEFADGLLAKHPKQLMAYNLSPSFNWDAAGMSDAEIGSFVFDLGKMGFVFQFITLAGFHATGLSTELLARSYAEKGMYAYVSEIQRAERKQSIATLTHQKWSGAYLVDRTLQAANGGLASTSSTGAACTEGQFSK